MKKKLAILLLAAMILSMAACGKQDGEDQNNNGGTDGTVQESTENETETGTENADGADVKDDAQTAGGALEILESVWATYEEDEKFYPYGGDSENIVENAPGAFDAAKAEELDSTLGFPAAEADKIDDAASIVHMLNANTFTAGVYHVTDTENIQAVADALKTNILSRHWMCGFPEKLIVVSVDNYLISAFGNGEVVGTFYTKLTTVYENASLLYDEIIE